MAGPHIASAEIDVTLDAKALSAQAKRIAKNFSNDFGDELDDGINAQMSKLGRDLRKEMEKNGEFAGKGFGQGLRRNAMKEAQKFYDDLRDAAQTNDFSKVAGRFDTLGDAISGVNKHLVLLKKNEEITVREAKKIADGFRDWSVGATAARDMEKAWSDLGSVMSGLTSDFKKMSAEATKAGRANENIFSAKAKKRLQDATRWEKEFGDVGKAAFEQVRTEMHQIGTDLEDLDRLTTTAQQASTALGKLQKTAGQKTKNAADVDAWDRAFQALTKDIEESRVQLDESAKSTKKLDKAFAKLDGSDRSIKRVSKSLAGINTELEKVHRTKALDELRTMFDSIKGGGSVDLDQATAAISRYEKQVTRTTKVTKKGGGFSLFSGMKGARNDFVNAIGSMGTVFEGFVDKVSGIGLKGFGQVAEQFGTWVTKIAGDSKVLQSAGSGISKFGSSLAEMGAAGGVASAGLGIVAALAAVAYAAQTAAGGLSVMAGAATALASVLATALGGALLSLGPIIGSVAAGVAGLALAFSQTSKGAEIGAAFQGELQVVGAAVAQALPPTKQLMAMIHGLGDALATVLGPVLGKTAAAILNFGSTFTKILGGSAVTSASKVFAETWPQILTNLLNTFGFVFEGISGVLKAISPAVSDVTGGFVDAAKAFSDWANSVGGQKTIKDFFDKSVKAAGDLWDIVKNLGGALGSLFAQGNDTGQTFLDKLVDITGKFNDFTKSAKGKKDIAQWFDDAKTAMGKVADVLKTVGQLFDKLDTKQTRKQFDQLVGGIENVISVLSTLYDWGGKIQSALSLSTTIKAFETLGSAIASGVSTGWDAVTGFFSTVGSTIASAAETSWTAVTGFFSGVGQRVVTAVSTGWSGVTSWFATAWSTIVAGVQTAIGNVITFFTALPGQILAALVALPSTLASLFATMWTNGWAALGTGIATAITIFAGFIVQVEDVLAALPGQVARFFAAAWNRAGSVTRTVGAAIVTFVTGLPGKIGHGLASLFSTIGNLFQTAWSNAKRIVSTLGGQIVTFVTGLPGKIVNGLSGLGSKLGSLFSEAWTTAKQKVTEGGGDVIQWFADLPSKIVSALGDASQWLYNVGRDVVEGLVSGIESVASAPIDAIKKVAGSLGDAAKRVLHINSPSKVFIGIGESVNEGLADGISGSAGASVAATQDVTNQVIAAGQNLANANFPVPSIEVGVDFYAAGASAVQDLSDGLLSGRGLLAGTMTTLANTMLTSLQTGLATTQSLAGAALASRNTNVTSPSLSSQPSTATPAPAVATVGGKSIVVAPGAIQVNTIASDAQVVARKVLDGLVTRVG